MVEAVGNMERLLCFTAPLLAHNLRYSRHVTFKMDRILNTCSYHHLQPSNIRIRYTPITVQSNQHILWFKRVTAITPFHRGCVFVCCTGTSLNTFFIKKQIIINEAWQAALGTAASWFFCFS